MMQLEKFNLDIKQGRSNYGILPVEFNTDPNSKIPFEVKRTYFVIANDENCVTGQHSHYEEKEVFLVLRGEADFLSLDENANEYVINIKPGEALYVPNGVWHGFKKIVANTVIAAFSSTNHNPDRSDYLEDKNQFIQKYIK